MGVDVGVSVSAKVGVMVSTCAVLEGVANWIVGFPIATGVGTLETWQADRKRQIIMIVKQIIRHLYFIEYLSFFLVVRYVFLSVLSSK